MSLLTNESTKYISDSHKEFVERYGEDKLNNIIDGFLEDIDVNWTPSGTPYQEDTEFEIEYHDQENDILWEIEFYSNIGDFKYLDFRKVDN